MSITVPNGYFQLDFVAGPVIDHLATNANVYYHAQGRFIDGALGGTQADGASTLSGTVDVTNASGQKVGLNIPGGVELILTGNDYTGKAVKQTVSTDANGNYNFTSLRASDGNGYRIVEVVPVGYEQVGTTPGSTGSIGSTSKYITTFLNTNTSSTDNLFLDVASKS